MSLSYHAYYEINMGDQIRKRNTTSNNYGMGIIFKNSL